VAYFSGNLETRAYQGPGICLTGDIKKGYKIYNSLFCQFRLGF